MAASYQVNRVILLGVIDGDPVTLQQDGVSSLHFCLVTDEKLGSNAHKEFHKVIMPVNRIKKELNLSHGNQYYLEGKIRATSVEKNGKKLHEYFVEGTSISLFE